jgi:2-polyprenyl-6-methoxyphenol hydroxylase-like FAD-dependent oxidoreductase
MRDARVRPDGHDPDVLIVGAGPVGLTLALGLARQGTRCRIVDRDAGPSPTSRASELHARTLEVLDAMGAAEDVLAAGLVLRVITFISRGRCVARLSTAGIDSSFPARLAIPQSDTERILESHLAQARVTVERERELLDFVDNGAGVTATFQDARAERTAIRAGWLVGCDGVHSAVRQHLGLAFDGEDYPGVWAIVDARIDGWACPPGEVFVFLGRDTMWSGPLPTAADGSISATTQTRHSPARRKRRPCWSDTRLAPASARSSTAARSGSIAAWRAASGWGVSCWPATRATCAARRQEWG